MSRVARNALGESAGTLGQQSDARSPPPGYVAAMGNPFGIALNPAWTEWAVKQGVSETIAAALYLLSENRKAEEVVGKLTPGELKRVIEVVGHQFNCCLLPGS